MRPTLNWLQKNNLQEKQAQLKISENLLDFLLANMLNKSTVLLGQWMVDGQLNDSL
jgi:hypothetical protein